MLHSLKKKSLQNGFLHTFNQYYQEHAQQLKYSIEALKIINDSKEIKWFYDSDKGLLDLSGNKLKVLTPLRLLRINKLILGGAKLKLSTFDVLVAMPLKSLDISYGAVQSLLFLQNSSIEELNIEGNPLTDLSPLKNTPIKIINIYKSSVEMDVLKTFLSLEKVICSAAQAAALKNILTKQVAVEIKP